MDALRPAAGQRADPGSLYALIAVGYTVVYGIVQLINFAHGEIFMIGAFGALSTWLIFFQGNTALWVLPFMILGAILASVAIGRPHGALRLPPLRNAPRLAPLITAIGVSVFLQEAVGSSTASPFSTSRTPSSECRSRRSTWSPARRSRSAA